jgi:hypothetical protein
MSYVQHIYANNKDIKFGIETLEPVYKNIYFGQEINWPDVIQNQEIKRKIKAGWAPFS